MILFHKLSLTILCREERTENIRNLICILKVLTVVSTAQVENKNNKRRVKDSDLERYDALKVVLNIRNEETKNLMVNSRIEWNSLIAEFFPGR